MKLQPQQQKSGKWRIQIYDYTDENGKRHNKSITQPTKKDCIAEAKEFIRQRELRSEKEKALQSYTELTYYEAAQKYIAIKNHVLSPTTVKSYNAILEYEQPDFKHIKLKYIDKNRVQHYINEISAKNSPKTVRNKGIFVTTVLNYFMDTKISVHYPQRKEIEYYIPTMDEFWQIYDAANDKLKVPILLGGLCGMRRGEICALTPEDVSLEGIRINKSKVRVDKAYIIKGPKTEASNRPIPAPPDVLAALLDWDYNIRPDYITQAFRKLCDGLGLKKVHFHTLRHMYTTELCDGGMNPQTVCSYTGHKNAEMVVKVYNHSRRSKKTDEDVLRIMTGTR